MADNYVIYDVRDYLPYTFNYKLLLFFVIPLILMIVIFLNWKKMTISIRILVIFLIVFFSFFGFSLFYNYHREKRILNDYLDGKYSSIEGVIEQYVEDDYHDYFEVSGIRFAIPEIYNISYSQRKTDGSILDNGMHIRVYYVNSSGLYIIFRIELLDLT